VTESAAETRVEAEGATAAPTTAERTLVAGPAVRSGRVRSYRRLSTEAGEPRRRRSPNGTPSALGPGARSLLRLVHFTDLQLADVQSPGRFEYFQLLVGRPEAGTFVPAQRPQEALAAHAAEALLRTVARVGESPDTAAPLGLALCTGDSIDNAQSNELSMFLALLSGGEVRAGSGGRGYDGVQAPGWPSRLYWHPDPETTDDYKVDFGFPEHPGLLDQAMAPFSAKGLALPWLSCFGNHEALILGTAVPTDAYRLAVTGSRKAVGPPSGLTSDLEVAKADFLEHPEHFLSGPGREVEADAERQIIGRAEFVAAHLRAGGLPEGHGFDHENLAASTAYAVYDDVEAVRVVLLDSTNLDGYYEGSIGRRQFAWLEDRLVEAHSRFRASDGREVRTHNTDRIVVLASHHGLATLTNSRQHPGGFEDDQPRVLGPEIRALLHRFGNVVLWLNGHRHLNEIVYWSSPYDDGTGIWEVSTASMADWPCQARVVELVAGRNGSLSMLSTMVDHDAPASPDEAHEIERLASLHRELAANVPGAGYDSALAGTPDDRNVELISKLPFPI
jgi:metallophosphoesterase (TIGR03767 family)